MGRSHLSPLLQDKHSASQGSGLRERQSFAENRVTTPWQTGPPLALQCETASSSAFKNMVDDCLPTRYGQRANTEKSARLSYLDHRKLTMTTKKSLAQSSVEIPAFSHLAFTEAEIEKRNRQVAWVLRRSSPHVSFRQVKEKETFRQLLACEFFSFAKHCK